MKRSRHCVFLSHCLLAQAVRANGLAKYFPAAVKPVVQFCLDHDINMMQMPCPETLCPAGGLGRDPHGKEWYEKRGLRETAREIAQGQVAYMEALIKKGFKVLAVIGMEFSPACATTLLNKGRRVVHGEGIFVEELKSAMASKDLTIPFIGVNQRGLKKLQRDLNSLLEREAKDSQVPTGELEDKA
jgi:predicted secreted protein